MVDHIDCFREALVKTTLDISDNLFRRARKLADREGKTFRAIVEESLAARLEAREPANKPYRLVLPSVKGEVMPEFADAGWNKIRDEILYPYPFPQISKPAA